MDQQYRGRTITAVPLALFPPATSRNFLGVRFSRQGEVCLLNLIRDIWRMGGVRFVLVAFRHVTVDVPDSLDNAHA